MLELAADEDANASVNLFKRAQDGDEDALNDLLARYLPRLRRWARGRLPSALRSIHSTEDVVQDAVMKALKHLDHIVIRSEGALLAYLRQAARNQIIDLHRRRVRRPARGSWPEDCPSLEQSPLARAIGTEAEARYERALEKLSDRDRQVVILKVEFDLSFQEIATALGLPSVAAARMAVSRGIARLAQHMEVKRTA